MIGLEQFKVKRIEESDAFGIFEIGPLPRGFGYTISNSLRRILLSSIEGSSVVGVRIDGIKHEFSTLEGLQEDIIALVLRLKDISVRLDEVVQATIKLNVKGKKGENLIIKTSDFEVPSSVTIINEDLEIAMLTSDVNFNIELDVEKGVGYVYPEEAKREQLGTIPLDGLFSPVKRVKVEIGKSRVGQDTDLDQIKMEVYTNGAVRPTEAMLRAAEIYDTIANRLVDMLGGDSAKLELEQESHELESQEEEVKVLISDLGLTTRLNNALLNAGITNLVDISKYSKDEVANFRGMGKKSLTELLEIMENHNIKFE
jgi:DNA-directed RNA polymerase subunit alpha